MSCYFHIFFDNCPDLKETKLQEIYPVVSGTHPNNLEKSLSINGFPWITTKDVSKQNNKFIFVGDRSLTKIPKPNKIFPKGTLLFTSGAPIGKIAIAGKELCTGNRLQGIIGRDFETHYIYFWFRENKKSIIFQSNGTTFSELSVNKIRRLPIKLPNSELIKKFNKLCHPIFEFQKNNEQEIKELLTLQQILIGQLN